ncbi:hypothetical protein [Flavobacterium panacagri]|uniref:hypothetical protein n=1 Tax=Flavobacterium panacagri TaxID=3034146 RepID=UPI0025A602FB|nr:hypothetical protein [Flavobacterium panacagri]
MKTRNSAKKRLMFIQKEDYNFLAYSTIILLYKLNCTSESNRFRDFRKIAYLVDFINEGGIPDDFSQKDLTNIYVKAQIKKKLMHHLVIILKNKNYIKVSLNESSKTIDLWLNKEEVPTDFFDEVIFQKEMQNVNDLKSVMTAGIRSITIKKLVEKIFNKNNVLTWEV